MKCAPPEEIQGGRSPSFHSSSKRSPDLCAIYASMEDLTPKSGFAKLRACNFPKPRFHEPAYDRDGHQSLGSRTSGPTAAPCVLETERTKTVHEFKKGCESLFRRGQRQSPGCLRRQTSEARSCGRLDLAARTPRPQGCNHLTARDVQRFRPGPS